MLTISGIQEGFVLDHIQAGMSLQIYHDLKLDELDCTVAIIKNVKSNKWMSVNDKTEIKVMLHARSFLNSFIIVFLIQQFLQVR